MTRWCCFANPVHGAGGDAFHFDNVCRELRVENCIQYRRRRLRLLPGRWLARTAMFTDCTSGPSVNHGWYVAGGNDLFTSCKAFYSGSTTAPPPGGPPSAGAEIRIDISGLHVRVVLGAAVRAARVRPARMQPADADRLRIRHQLGRGGGDNRHRFNVNAATPVPYAQRARGRPVPRGIRRVTRSRRHASSAGVCTGSWYLANTVTGFSGRLRVRVRVVTATTLVAVDNTDLSGITLLEFGCLRAAAG